MAATPRQNIESLRSTLAGIVDDLGDALTSATAEERFDYLDTALSLLESPVPGLVEAISQAEEPSIDWDARTFTP